MNSGISSNLYKFISDNLGESQSLGTDIANNVGNMLAYLNNNELRNSDSSKQIIARAIFDTYSILLRDHTNISEQMHSMVSALQEHVSHRYGTVNAFLKSSGITVSQSFANLSADLGYEIDPIYVE